MKKLKLKLLAMKIEWHWLFIKPYRKKINDLVETGMKLTDPKLLRVYDVLMSHGEWRNGRHSRFPVHSEPRHAAVCAFP